jgi:hypothetical protein
MFRLRVVIFRFVLGLLDIKKIIRWVLLFTIVDTFVFYTFDKDKNK